MTGRPLATAAAAVLVVLSGCGGLFGPTPVGEGRLDADPAGADDYDWDADVDVHIVVTPESRFRAVYRLNRTTTDELELYRRDALGGRSPLRVEAVRYRFANGTVVNGSAFDDRGGGVDRTGDAVRVRLPTDPENGTGRLAFSSRSPGKRFSIPTYVSGSYEVVLPTNRRTTVPLAGSVRPGGFDREVVDGRTHLRWESVERDAISVRYYLQRDILIFGGLVALLAVVAAAGTLRYRRQIARLRERREAVEDADDPPDDDSRSR